MQKIKWLCGLMCLGVVAWGCGAGAPLDSRFIGLRMDDSEATAAGIDAVVAANNRFALDVYAALKKDNENLFLSPYSISTALAMTYEGARGQTAEEMARVFYFPTDNTERRAAYAALHNGLNAEDAAYDLRVANALWAQQNYTFLETYLATLQNYYAASATNLDFAGATEAARQTINAWVEDRTNNKIKDLFPKDTLSPSTRLVLTNAIYFKGQWAAKFDRGQTKDEPFYTAANQAIRVPMMRQTGDDVFFKYAEHDGVQILELPYEGEKLSMILLLPAGGTMAAFEDGLSPAKLEAYNNALHLRRVDVFLPRFTFETKYLMNETLKHMGMPTAFSGAADFSGMDGTRSLAIQTVVHQAFVDVNEEGTEAAAATGVAVAESSVPPPAPVFRADRPFLFLIQDVERGNILFLGKVVNPQE